MMNNQEFLTGLKNFVDGFIANSEKKRWRDQTERQMVHEIEWCRLQLRKSRSMKHHDQLRHQIRHKELVIAFLDME